MDDVHIQARYIKFFLRQSSQLLPTPFSEPLQRRGAVIVQIWDCPLVKHLAARFGQVGVAVGHDEGIT